MYNFYWFTLCMAVNAMLLILLTINVSRLRRKHKISSGDGGNKTLLNAIRVHGNGTEQVPIFALLILALSFARASSTELAVLVIAFTASRFIHAYGMIFRTLLARQLGAIVTYIAQAAAVVILLLTINI